MPRGNRKLRPTLMELGDIRFRRGVTDDLVREELDRIRRNTRLAVYYRALIRLAMRGPSPRPLVSLRSIGPIVGREIRRLNRLTQCRIESEELRWELEEIRHHLCVMALQGQVWLTGGSVGSGRRHSGPGDEDRPAAEDTDGTA